MKELNITQIKNVSGAGIFANTFSGIASFFGGVAEFAGWKNAKNNASDLGKNAGYVIDSAMSTVGSFFNLLFRK